MDEWVGQCDALQARSDHRGAGDSPAVYRREGVHCVLEDWLKESVGLHGTVAAVALRTDR